MDIDGRREVVGGEVQLQGRGIRALKREDEQDAIKARGQRADRTELRACGQ